MFLFDEEPRDDGYDDENEGSYECEEQCSAFSFECHGASYGGVV